MLNKFVKFFPILFVTIFSISSLCGGQNMSAQTPLVVLLGAPGSGKGTQAAKIVQEFDIVHISTGDILRHNVKNQTPIGKKAKEFMDAGQLVPGDIVVTMLQERLKEPDCQKGALLDGFPRTLDQAKALEEMIGDRYKVVVISLEVSDQTVIDRLTGRRSCPVCNAIYHVMFTPSQQEGVCDGCGGELITRADDTEKTVKERLAIFHSQVGPLKEFYAKRDLLNEIDGEDKAGAESISRACLKTIRDALDS